MMLTIDEIAERYQLLRANVILRMARVSNFGGRDDEATVWRLMEPALDEPEEDIDEVYRWLHNEMGF